MKPRKIEFNDGTAYCETCRTELQFLAERCKCQPPATRPDWKPAVEDWIKKQLEKKHVKGS